MEPGVAADQRGQFGSTESPHPAVAAQSHGLVRRKVADRVGGGPIHGRTKIER